MPRTVFWSWQSDLPGRTNRNLIKRALEAALKDVMAEAEIEERLELDHDTKGNLGLVSIPDTILSKIDNCDLFVADLTPIAVSDAGKFVANPNVLIELGYAKRAIGSERIILVWNSAFPGCQPELLPFDLRHRRAPLSYQLPIEHDETSRLEQRDALTKTFITIFGQYRPKRAVVPAPAPVKSRPGDPSAWFTPNEVLRVAAGTSYGDDLLRHPETKRGYGRIIPLESPPRRPRALEEGDAVVPFGRTNGRSWGRTKGGFISYGVSERDGQNVLARTSTMYFNRTSELWGVDHSFVWEDGSNVYRLATNYIIHECHKFLKHHLGLYEREGLLGPLKIEFGINDLTNTFWPRARYDYTDRGALETSWTFEVTLDSSNPAQSIGCARALMESLFDAFGMPSYEEDHFLAMLKNWRA